MAASARATGDCRDAASQRIVLLNPLVDVAVFETSLDRTLVEGLGFDNCQVSVITAMGEGLRLDLEEGDTPEKHALIYRAASDVVLPGGTVIVKAGEPLGPIIAKHSPGELILFRANAAEPGLREHRAAGGKAVIANAREIQLTQGNETVAKLPTPSPASPIEPVLAAVAAAWALGICADRLAATLAEATASAMR